MNILFGQSYYLRFDPKLYQAMQPYPPLGTMYAASFMRQKGYSVALFDAMLAESAQEWAEALDKHRPRFAVIYEDNFNYLSKMCLLNMRQAAFTMIGMAQAFDCVVIVAGSDAADHASQYLEAGADFVIRGEGEETLAELIEQLTINNEQLTINNEQLTINNEQLTINNEQLTINNEQLTINNEQLTINKLLAVPGIAFKASGDSASGNSFTIHNSQFTIHCSPPRPVMRDIDRLPFPAWDLVDVEKYRRIWYERHGYYSMNMVTTRGCPYHCNWCAKPIWGQRYNSRSPKNVAQEMKWLGDTFDPDHIWFADDIMGLKPGWWSELTHHLRELDVSIPFKCLSRADLIARDAAEVEALAAAGCKIVWMGAESGSQKILNGMEKGTTVAQIYEAARLLKGAGIQVAFFLQFGYPGETRADIERTLQMVRDCAPDDIGMSVSYPLPGTKFYENIKLQLGEKQNWTDSADLAMMYRGPFTTAFYRQLHVTLHKEFRSRKAWQALRQVASRPSRWRRHHLRELAATAYRLATLPLARRKLDQLAAIPHEGLSPLPHMSLEEAARPSPQGDRD